MRERYDICVITNDIYTKEDAEILMRMQALPLDRIMGVETGGCPHAAIREDISANCWPSKNCTANSKNPIFSFWSPAVTIWQGLSVAGIGRLHHSGD